MARLLFPNQTDRYVKFDWLYSQWRDIVLFVVEQRSIRDDYALHVLMKDGTWLDESGWSGSYLFDKLNKSHFKGIALNWCGVITITKHIPWIDSQNEYTKMLERVLERKGSRP